MLNGQQFARVLRSLSVACARCCNEGESKNFAAVRPPVLGDAYVASAPSPASRSEAASAASGSVSSRPAVDITAVTTRDDFLLELGQTLDGQAAVRPVDTL